MGTLAGYSERLAHVGCEFAARGRGGGGIGRGGALQCSTVEFAEMGGAPHPSSRGGFSVKKLGHMSNVAGSSRGGR